MCWCVEIETWLIGYHNLLWGTISSWSETDPCVGFDVGLNNNELGTDSMRPLAIISVMWMDLQDNGMFRHQRKICQNFFNEIFWKFNFWEKKSADFSCLFTFFLTKCKFKKIYTTIWEIPNFLKKIVICLHFCITT